MWVAGVDGYKKGWIVALRNLETCALQLTPIAHISALETLPERPRRIAVDMPIGFLDVARKGGRECEQLTRKKLPGKTASVFSAPARATLNSDVYEDACRINRSSGPDYVAISRQAFSIRKKLREVDGWINPARQQYCFESHPELAFTVLNGGTPVASKKRDKAGQDERKKLLSDAGLFITKEMLAKLPTGCKVDDALDAIVLTITAERHHHNKAECLPLNPTLDSRQLQMAIWF